MKLREDMKPTEGQTELQPLQYQEEDNHQQKDDPHEDYNNLKSKKTFLIILRSMGEKSLTETS